MDLYAQHVMVLSEKYLGYSLLALLLITEALICTLADGHRSFMLLDMATLRLLVSHTHTHTHTHRCSYV